MVYQRIGYSEDLKKIKVFSRIYMWSLDLVQYSCYMWRSYDIWTEFIFLRIYQLWYMKDFSLIYGESMDSLFDQVPVSKSRFSKPLGTTDIF